jgi:cytochrome c oxidase subunit 2
VSEADTPSILDPAGPEADAVAVLWWWMLGAGLFVLVLVLVLLGLALLRGSTRKRAASPTWTRKAVVVLGIGLPAVILIPLSVATILVGRELDAVEPPEPLVVEVVGHQFWWEVRYPGLDVVTANEVHIPVGVPVEFRLRSEDVVHAFWVPQLAGKLDMIPGRETSYQFSAGKPGVYEGECAEFCGIQHAKMRFVLVAEPAQEFQEWVVEQRRPPLGDLPPLAEKGREVFRTSSCAACHTVEGVSDGDVGPDLTHLATRRTLAAGILENNRGNLGGWILDPQSLKQGVRMPGTSLSGPELQALLAFLEELE